MKKILNSPTFRRVVIAATAAAMLAGSAISLVASERRDIINQLVDEQVFANPYYLDLYDQVLGSYAEAEGKQHTPNTLAEAIRQLESFDGHVESAVQSYENALDDSDIDLNELKQIQDFYDSEIGSRWLAASTRGNMESQGALWAMTTEVLQGLPSAEDALSPNMGGEIAHAAVINVNDKTFRAEVEESSLPVVVDFYASWCGPCKRMHPIMEKLAAEYGNKYKFVKVDIDDARGLADRFSVKSIPTFLFFKDGKLVGTEKGASSESAFLSKIEKYLG